MTYNVTGTFAHMIDSPAIPFVALNTSLSKSGCTV